MLTYGFWERAGVRFLHATRLPLYRQAEIFARDGVSLETSTLSGWVGATAAALKPLVAALAAEILASDNLHVDDTPVPVLAPGTG
jgi:transposase